MQKIEKNYTGMNRLQVYPFRFLLILTANAILVDSYISPFLSSLSMSNLYLQQKKTFPLLNVNKSIIFTTLFTTITVENFVDKLIRQQLVTPLQKSAVTLIKLVESALSSLILSLTLMY